MQRRHAKAALALLDALVDATRSAGAWRVHIEALAVRAQALAFRMKLLLALAWQPQVRDDPNTDVPQQTRRRQESRSGSANQRRS